MLISEKYGDDAIYKDGLKIYTTLDMDAQNAAVAAMQNLPTMYTDQNGLHQPQGAIVAMNPHNGYIVAMVGGRGDDAFNRASQAGTSTRLCYETICLLSCYSIW